MAFFCVFVASEAMIIRATRMKTLSIIMVMMGIIFVMITIFAPKFLFIKVVFIRVAGNTFPGAGSRSFFIAHNFSTLTFTIQLRNMMIAFFTFNTVSFKIYF